MLTVCRLPKEGSNKFYRLQTEWDGESFSMLILDEVSAWTGKLSSLELNHLSRQLFLGNEEYINETRKALTSDGGDEQFTYSIENHQFSWKKVDVETDIRVKYGFVHLMNVPVFEAFENMIDILLDRNQFLQQQVKNLENLKDSMEKEISVMTVQAAEVCRPRPAANHRRASKPNPHRNRTNSASKSTQNVRSNTQNSPQTTHLTVMNSTQNSSLICANQNIGLDIMGPSQNHNNLGMIGSSQNLSTNIMSSAQNSSQNILCSVPNSRQNMLNTTQNSDQNMLGSDHNSGQNVLNSAQSSGGSNPGSPPNSGRSSPDSTHNDSTDLITPEILAGSGGSGSKNVDCAALVASIKASIDVTKRGTPRKRKKYILSPSQRRALKLNILKQTHGVHQPCENCRKKCVTKITQERRVDINKQFWDLGWMERRVFILNNSTRAEVKRHRGTKDIRKRTNSFNYYLKDQKGERHGVCKTFFLTTLGFSKHNDTVLHNVLCKTEPGSIVPKPDMRGKHVAAIRQKQKSNSEKLEWVGDPENY